MLIGYEIQKQPMPNGFGEGPKYVPFIKTKKDFSRNSRNPFHKKRPNNN
jgi:hypothetical protein